MSLPEIGSLESLSLAELRELVGVLMGEVRRLQADNQALRDEVARLKGLPPRPPLRPSGMEKATGAASSGKTGRRSRRRRGVKRDRDAVTAEVVLTASVPGGSRFKGYQDILVRDLRLSAEVVRYRRERWVTPSGETVVARLPAGIVGGFGPALRRFILAAHVQGQVTTERLVALLTGIGVAISKRQVVRLLTGSLNTFIEEDHAVLQAGLATARWITVDDTAARHGHADGFTTQVGDDRFTAFRTGPSKSRQAFLSLLRAGHTGYVINDAALGVMRGLSLAGPLLARLAAHPAKRFADEATWTAHLTALGISQLDVTPDPVRVATEGALWGAIRDQGLLTNTVIVSDGARQFRVGTHPCGGFPNLLRRSRTQASSALCWVHAERLVHKLVPATPAQRRAIETTQSLIWWFYADLKSWKRDLCPRRAAALRARFDRIFRRRTGYLTLDRLMARLHRQKADLLRVLQHPDIPLHTNGSENDIRSCVTKRKISGGTVSDRGRTARNVMLGLMKTCAKLGVSFFRYLGDRLNLPSGTAVPPLPDLVRQAQAAM
ncbi:IS66 family transposase [Lichenifustis flavocetrariae]|uniref:Transposase n=1 Tax=Lichenifustis flavocetrariae TaxID=2949735 RepID=A0AA42CS90_9HYPH|nr:transposase [Lichenifustis flavocetrariae]MCW6513250.1 transposase [Lichenifustis flavocetrariae]